MNELATTANTMVFEESAVELHKQILYNYRMAAYHLVDACRGLKQMRDSKAYISLGMESFEQYTEQMAGIKARQAYTYISTLERLGETVMEENADIGITKLSLLAEITPAERAGFAAENDLAGMTVKEVEELIAEKKRLGEQLSLFQTEIVPQQEDMIAGLKYQLKQAQAAAQPAPVEQITIVQASDEQLEQIRAEERAAAIAAAAQDQQAAIDAAVSDAMAAVRDKQEKDKEKLAKAKAAKEEAEKEAAALREQMERERASYAERVQQAQAAGDGDLRVANIHFEQLQENMNSLLRLIGQIKEKDQEKGAKFSGAVVRFLEQITPSFKELHERAL